MSMMTATQFYTGKGQSAAEKWRDLPSIDPDELNHPAGYLAPEGLVAAVNVALELGMPLLLTGEPGCGKSQLAHSLAWELGFPKAQDDLWPKPLCFNVKSDTQSRDLFYSFDTLGRFRAARIENEKADAEQYLRFEPLGTAILRALGKDKIEKLGLAQCLDNLPERPERSVVLIDEIDKAPREVPNDILNEIDRLSFEIPELFKPGKQKVKVELKKDTNNPDNLPLRPVIIITSNRERDLPEAFLRRCVYYHVDLPPFRSKNTNGKDDITIETIIEKRLKLEVPIPVYTSTTPNLQKTVWAGSVSLFKYLREARLEKSPSTAELLSWLLLLKKRLPDSSSLTVRDVLPEMSSTALVTLFKHMDDQQKAPKLIDDWSKLIEASAK